MLTARQLQKRANNAEAGKNWLVRSAKGWLVTRQPAAGFCWVDNRYNATAFSHADAIATVDALGLQRAAESVDFDIETPFRLIVD